MPARAISCSRGRSQRAWISRNVLWKHTRATWSADVAEAIIAIVHNEVETLQRLLDTQPDSIPRYDRHEAAMKTQQYRLAQDSFQRLTRRPHDDEMHLRHTNSVLVMHHSAEVGQTHFRRGVIDGRERVADVGSGSRRVFGCPRCEPHRSGSGDTRGASTFRPRHPRMA